MLFSKDFRRNHQRRLVSILHRSQHCLNGYDSFAASDIALEQTVHRRIRLHVRKDLLDHSILRASQCEGECRINSAPELREGEWVELDYDLPSASKQSGLSQYELLTTLGARFERRWV